MNKVGVIIASIPWRRENALRLVDSVLAQGYPVLLLLDGYTPSQLCDIEEQYKNDAVAAFITDERGYIARWRCAFQYERFVIIDDDQQIQPRGIKRFLTELERTGAALISWSGWLKNGEYKSADRPLPGDAGLELFGTNVAGYSKDMAEFWLSDYANHDKIDRFMTLDSDGLISAFYHSRDKQMICPGGPSYVQEVHKYSRDNRRLYTHARKALPRLRKELGLQCP